ncbi:Fic family protein [Dactylosporangium sp. NPDC051484]|uniref:type II toxin-antitoxin system death-on-curing family toxin n=1 Tax=Dactylosporangium sp. NPDC051484 TaxID=3154942 RepID=UPI00344B9433
MTSDVQYLTWDDYVRAAAHATQFDADTVRKVANRSLVESAINAPAAGWGEFEQYPFFPVKAAVLLERLAKNHPLPDGNKRAALLATIFFANLNGYDWEPPFGDDPDGEETDEIVRAVAGAGIPLPALAAWVEARLVAVPPPLDTEGPTTLVSYPAEWIGELPYEKHTVQVGDLQIHDVHGYNPAGVYVRRISGKTDGVSVAEIIISVVGDGYAQEELDAENAEAERHPLGPKEFWRGRMVGKYTYGADGHLMTEEDFEAEWAEDEEPASPS